MNWGAFTLLALISGATLSCTKSPQWKTEEWQGEGKISLPASFTHQLSQTTLRSQHITFHTQQVFGVTVEGSFAKVVENKNAKLTEESTPTSWARLRYIAESDLPSPQLVQRGMKLQKNVLQSTRKQLSATLGCKQVERAMSSLQPRLQLNRNRWQVIFRGSCQVKNGEEKGFSVRHSGEIFAVKVVSTAFKGDVQEVAANLYPRGPKTSQLSLLKLSVSTKPNYLFTSSLDTVSEGGIKISDLNQVAEIKSSDARFDLLQVHFYATRLLNWLSQTFAFQPEALKIYTHVGFPEKTNAAFYFNHEVRLGGGDGVVFSNLSWDASIVSHEIMHSVIETLTRLPFNGQGGSLNEGLADILTALHLGSPRMGENSYLRGPFQRTLENNLTLNDLSGKLYGDSLILSGTLWEIASKTNSQIALSLVEYLLTYLTPTSGFEDAKLLITKWLPSLNLDSHFQTVETILTTRGWL